MSPSQVNLTNEKQVWNYLYGEELTRTPIYLQKKLKALQDGEPLHVKTSTLSIGDPVRLSKRKRKFEKAFYQNWTDEIFVIAHISKANNPTTYRLSDFNGELLEGIFYRHEITPIRFAESKYDTEAKVYAVEKIINKETRKDGKTYFFVKWTGYPDTENQWIRADQFASIKKAT